jgi:hypothetical protein
MISSSRFPLESVFLGSTVNDFSSAVMDAQKGCVSTDNETACNANTTSLEGNVLETAMAYRVAAVNSTTTATVGAAPPAPDLTASWDLPGWPREAYKQQHMLPAIQHPDDTTSAPPAEESTDAHPPPADAPLVPLPMPAPLLPLAAGSTAARASAVETSSSGTVVVSTSAGTSTTVSEPLLKGKHGWPQPIKASGLFEDVFGTAEYVPSAANYPGTKAALSSLKILLRIPATKKKP